MPNDDTIKLLRECNAGIKMGVNGLSEVIPRTDTDALRNILEKSLQAHEHLGDETHQMLNQFHDEGKEPSPIASAMSWMKTEFKLISNHVDQEIADLMTEGCSMGIKSICRYLNQYPTATSEAKAIANRLITIEEDLAKEMRPYL